VSRRTDYIDFHGTRRLWLGAYETICPRELGGWIQDWKLALSNLPYVQRVFAGHDPTLDELLSIRFASHFPLGSSEIIQADLESLWTGTIATELRAVHTFLTTDGGLELHFACVTQLDQVVTGIVSVTKK